MMTVRFPIGFSVQYNDANHATRNVNGYTDLYTKEGRWIAQVPTAGCIVEVVKPCRTYRAGEDPDDLLDAMFKFVVVRNHSMTWTQLDKLAKIKKQLRSFDALRKRWKS